MPVLKEKAIIPDNIHIFVQLKHQRSLETAPTSTTAPRENSTKKNTNGANAIGISLRRHLLTWSAKM